MSFYAIPSGYRQKVVTIRPFSIALQSLLTDSGSIRNAITKPSYHVVLHHPICPPPEGRHQTSISHGATESSEGGFPEH
ncbi:hypothetical protein B9Z19DRAFT_1118996 [Tuber borchii]|uniref:Uncharacterized protein n=1 Tax=Tuber borchii TaxID=42251 RepID=A0A2T7A7E9_TUBBO|nr:hypothetical protein B9Z19DRAFT_1135706 [Tuber borchii]PUU83635.1 hypothetical protein B9Z19DRAFT_1118996 [Tuber borchii]